MATVRIAVASTPLTATLDEAVPRRSTRWRRRADSARGIVCLPETAHPGPPGPAPAGAGRLRCRRSTRPWRASRRPRAGPASSRSSGRERPTPAGREIVSVVLGADGTRAGRPGEDADRPERGGGLRPGHGPPRLRRRRPDVRDRDLPRGVPLPGDHALARPRRRAGRLRARTSSRPTTARCPTRWCDAANPYNEKALLCRALENTRLRRRVERGRPRPGLGHGRHRPGRHARREAGLRSRGRRRRGHRP